MAPVTIRHSLRAQLDLQRGIETRLATMTEIGQSNIVLKTCVEILSGSLNLFWLWDPRKVLVVLCIYCAEIV